MTKEANHQFKLNQMRGFWKNSTDKGTFAHDVKWNRKTGVESKIGAIFNYDDHKWMFRLKNDGEIAAALNW
jgi:hypothetical protein